MATMVCRGLQSCLESQLLEPRTIRLKLSCHVDEKRCHYDGEKQTSSSTADDYSHCWSFFQAISNNGPKLESRRNKETPTTYVHPLDTRSKSTLSDKSLELCTENLGSETGTEIIEDDSSSSSSGGEGIFSSARSENGGNISPRRGAIKKATARNFPPPLTTICGGVASLQVRPHREDGRLIIKATISPSSQYRSLFQAERSHGRLRLTLFKDSEEEEIESDIEATSCGDNEEEEAVDDDADDDDVEEEKDGDGNIKDIGGEWKY